MAGDAGQDAIDGSVGSDAQGVAVGSGITQQRSDPRQSISFTNTDNMTLWFKLLEMSGDIRDLAQTLDDLPGKLARLTNRVDKIESVEVTVKPGAEVTVRSVAGPSLTDRMLLIILFVALIVMLLFVGFFLYWVVRNA